MFEDLSELHMAQEDGGPPTALSAGSARGESGVFVLRSRFEGCLHVAATAQRHHVYFNLSGQSRFECCIAGRALTHEPPSGSLAVCPAGSDYAADIDGSGVTILVAVDPRRLALAAAEDSALDAHLVDRLSGHDQALFDLACALASDTTNAYANGPLFWNEMASAFIDGLLARHTANFDGEVRGALGNDVLKRLRDYIMAHLDEPIEVAALARLAGRSEFHFTRVFTRSVGTTPHRYVVHHRLQRAVELLRDGRFGLADIAASTGFADQSHLSRWVRRVHGVSPTQIAA
jgi:AraC family transcriptional regulator